MNIDELIKKIAKVIDERLDEKLEPIKQELKEHGILLDEHSKQLKLLEEHSKLLKEHSKQLKLLTTYARKTQKTQTEILDFLDKQDVTLQKRVSRLEECVGLTPAN